MGRDGGAGRGRNLGVAGGRVVHRGPRAVGSCGTGQRVRAAVTRLPGAIDAKELGADDTSLRAWLLTVARREYIDYRRAQVFDLSRFLAWGRQPDPMSAAGSLRQDIEVALQQLSDADREVLLLVAVDELAPKEAAHVLGITPVALRQRLSRARQRFASALEGERRPSHSARTGAGKVRP